MDNTAPIIVVVDDNAVIRSQFQRGIDLLDIDLELVTFSSAEAAMKYLENTKPKILFLDILLPDKDGITLLAELRKLPLHYSTFVIMITSKDYTQDRTLACELGALEFLLKPIPKQVIADIICKYIGNNNPY